MSSISTHVLLAVWHLLCSTYRSSVQLDKGETRKESDEEWRRYLPFAIIHTEVGSTPYFTNPRVPVSVCLYRSNRIESTTAPSTPSPTVPPSQQSQESYCKTSNVKTQLLSHNSHALISNPGTRGRETHA